MKTNGLFRSLYLMDSSAWTRLLMKSSVNIDKGLFTGMIMFGCAEAFGTVDHNNLLYKLKAVDAELSTITWFNLQCSQITNRLWM